MSNVLNYFNQPIDDDKKDNIFVLNGTWKVDNEEVTKGGSYLSGQYNVVTKSIDYITSSNDDVILCNCSGGAITITLYTAINNSGRMIAIKKIDNSNNNVIINTNDSETIDGDPTFNLVSKDESIKVISDNSNWYII